MKKPSLTLLIICCSILSTFAQDPAQLNFHQLIDTLYVLDSSLQLPDSLKSGVQKDFDRMHYIWSPRLHPQGDVAAASQAQLNYALGFTACGTKQQDWREVGPIGTAGMGGGQINRLAFSPNYNDTTNRTIYAASFFGGLWRSDDSGDNWYMLNTDHQLPQTAVSGIAISHQNDSILFIATGDGDMRNANNIKNEYLPGAEGIALPTFTYGVYRSTDQGQNWLPINDGLLSHFADGGAIRKIIINPLNDNTLICATSRGVFKTTNATATQPTWTKLSLPSTLTDEDCKGLEYHPTDTFTLYIGTKDILRSTDAGNSWHTLTGASTQLQLDSLPFNFTVRRINLAVTPAAPSHLYAYINGYDTSHLGRRLQAVYIFKYKNGNWQQLEYRSDKGRAFEANGVTWMGLAVSPLDTQKIFYGHTKVRGTDSSGAFVIQSPYLAGGYHADVHDLVFQPNIAEPKLYCANHGGVSVKDLSLSYALVENEEIDPSWSYKNDGLNTNLIWAFDVNKLDSNLMIMGRQDNGVNSRNTQGIWHQLEGGDGYGAQIAFDAANRNYYLYNSVHNFPLPINAKTVALDTNLNPIDPKKFEKLTVAFQINDHPYSQQPIAGFSELYTSPTNHFPTVDTARNKNVWRVQSDLYRHLDYTGARRIREFVIAPSDTNRVYLASFGQDGAGYATNLFRSTTGLRNGTYDSLNYGGVSAPPVSAAKFQPITANLPRIHFNNNTYAPFITGIAVSDLDADKVWLSFSGFQDSLKVYHSADGGNTWQNADPQNSLPNLPANNIVLQAGSNDRLYLATDAGVFYKDNSMSCWHRLGNIPNTKVMELRINRACGQPMLYAATYGRGIWSAVLEADNSTAASPTYISSNTHWTTPQVLLNDLHIQAGAKLTISSTLKMAPETEIHIQRNAVLEVNGGTITNYTACDNSFWQGIWVYGESKSNQFPLSHPYDQGKLILKNNALIENARYAIRPQEPNVWSTFGGLIEAENSTIRNTRRAVEFMKYDSLNHSYFKNVTFINEASIQQLDSTISLPKVTLWDNKGVKFTHCKFIDESPYNQYSNYRNLGIYSIDATYSVIGACNLEDGNCNDSTTALFKNVNEGISVLNSGSISTVVVDQVKFSDNPIAFRTKEVNQVRFTNNRVDFGKVIKSGYLDSMDFDYKYQMGFFSQFASGYSVEGNDFISHHPPVENTAGIFIDESGLAANETYRNHYQFNSKGQIFRGENRQSSTVGLQFLCDSNEFNTTDVKTEASSTTPTAFDGIRDLQGFRFNSGIGLTLDGSVNVFTDMVPDYHIDNGANALNYYDIALPRRVPTQFRTGAPPVNVIAPSSITNTCQVRDTSLFPTDTVIKEMITSFYPVLESYHTLLYNFHQLIDNGNTDSLVQAIQLTTSSQAQQMRDYLIAQSPFVSQQSLSSAAHSGVLSDAYLLEVCLANPQATQSEDFLNELEFKIPNPLPSSMIQLIYQNWDVENTRTLMEKDLAAYSSEVGYLGNKIIHYYAMNSLDRSDSIDKMLRNLGDLNSRYQRVELHLGKDDFTKAWDALTEIEQNVTFNDAQQAEYDNFNQYLNVRENFFNEDKIIMNLDEAGLEELRDVANQKTGRSSELAQNILCFGYQECGNANAPQARIRRQYPKRYYLPKEDALVATDGLENQAVQLSPNPAEDEIKVSIQEWEEEQNYLLKLSTVEGKVLLEKRLIAQQSLINLDGLKKGIYLYEVWENEKQLKSGKLIVQ